MMRRQRVKPVVKTTPQEQLRFAQILRQGGVLVRGYEDLLMAVLREEARLHETIDRNWRGEMVHTVQAAGDRNAVVTVGQNPTADQRSTTEVTADLRRALPIDPQEDSHDADGGDGDRGPELPDDGDWDKVDDAGDLAGHNIDREYIDVAEEVEVEAAGRGIVVATEEDLPASEWLMVEGTEAVVHNTTTDNDQFHHDAHLIGHVGGGSGVAA